LRLLDHGLGGLYSFQPGLNVRIVVKRRARAFFKSYCVSGTARPQPKHEQQKGVQQIMKWRFDRCFLHAVPPFDIIDTCTV
jgi:hypothetical protein